MFFRYEAWRNSCKKFESAYLIVAMQTKIIFIDTEFTGEHQNTTLVSLGLVTLTGEKLYLTLNDYDRSQVTDWLKENVLVDIDAENSIDSVTAAKKLEAFLSGYSEGQKIYVVSAGLMQDLTLFFELFKFCRGETNRQFHLLHDLPDYLQHHCGIDLNTLFRVAGMSPSISREEFAGISNAKRHNALSDAEVVRLCYLKLIKNQSLNLFLESINER